MSPTGCPGRGDALAGSEILLVDPSGAVKAEVVAGGLAVPNPFAEMTREAPLEAELRELAAQDSGVRLTETYQIKTGTPAECSLAVPTGSQAPEDLLACIGMSVRVTRTLEAEGVPTGEMSDTGGERTRTHTVITQQETQGVILGALNNPSWPDASGLLGATEEDDLYKVNTDFAADLLKDGGGTVAQLIETYHPTSDSPIDVPTLEVDYNQFDLDESGSGPEAKTSPDREPRRSAIPTEDSNSGSLADAPQTGASETRGPSAQQPNPQMETPYIEITGVGSFQRESRKLPIWLRAYPDVKPTPAPLADRRPQAYREQDRYKSHLDVCAWHSTRQTQSPSGSMEGSRIPDEG